MKLLVPDWRQSWRWLSVHVLVLIGVMPDLYNGIVAMGWINDPAVPAPLKWALRALGAAGIFARLLSQAKTPKPSLEYPPKDSGR